MSMITVERELFKDVITGQRCGETGSLDSSFKIGDVWQISHLREDENGD